MKVFVTGATGFIGSKIVLELLSAGHEVLGLARSDESARALEKVGAKVHRGSITDLESLKAGAKNSDGVIHTAFNHDFSTFAQNCEDDRGIIEALGSGLIGSKRPLIVTSGTTLLPAGILGKETDPTRTGPHAHPRKASEEAANSLLARGVHTSIVRLPPSVHAVGDYGFVPMLYNLAKEKGISGYIGEGKNRWPAVHRLDAARLFRLALEKGALGGIYHGNSEEGVLFKDIATSVGRHLDLPVQSVAPETFGWFSHFAAMDNPTSNELTRNILGWNPEHMGLIEDLAHKDYFSKQ